jgi:tRNA uridine 5-carboxymethylaminomethyl modification enzyme
MMTSRTEYRLLQRQDNADERLSAVGYELGLVSREDYERVQAKYAAVAAELERLEHCGAAPSEQLSELLERRGEPPARRAQTLSELLRRPRISYEDLKPFDPNRPELDRAVTEQVEIRVKYQGYIERQLRQVEQARKMEGHLLPPDLDYDGIQGMRLEAREKLKAIQPRNLGQASRVSGVSPADIAALMVFLER